MIESPSPDRADLRALLEDAPYIDDEGFSDRVVRALPRRRPTAAFSYAIVPTFAALACVLAYVLGGRAFASHPAAYLPLSVVMTWSFLAAALSLIVVASATLLTTEE